MTIIKKHINTWFGNTVILRSPTRHLIKIKFIYVNDGTYEITVYLAKRPQNKYFKGWKQIGYCLDIEDKYPSPSIEEMLKTNAIVYLQKHLTSEKLREKRIKNWEEFSKNS